MKIALFHNYMDNIGGAEIVTLTFARELNADIYTTIFDTKHIINAGFADVIPRIKSIGRIPKQAPFKQQLASLRFRRLNLGRKYDFYIISGDWAMSGAVNNKPNLWYVHSPLNELWQFRDMIKEKMISKWKHPIYDLWVWFNRKLTLSYSKHVDLWACNSGNTQGRIKKFYGKEAEIIYPPIDTTKYKNGNDQGYWLSVNRLIDHKRVEIQLGAFAQLPGERLVVVGSYEKNVTQFEKYRAGLEKMRPSNVEFKQWVSDKELVEYYSHCKGFITTARDEDFGMTAVEAMASGKMVIAPKEGGYKESVLHGKTGMLIDDITPKKLADAIIEANVALKNNPNHYVDECLKRAAIFDTKSCVTKIKKMIDDSDEKLISLRNNYTGTYPTVYHQPGDLLKDSHDTLLDLSMKILEGPSKHFGCPEDLALVTWSNRTTSLLEKICEHLGVPLKIYGKDIVDWKNHYETKLKLMHEACLNEKTKYIMGLDSRDILFIAPPKQILDEFKKMNIGMLFGAESQAEKGGYYQKMPDLKSFFKSLACKEKKYSKGSPFIYLNAGQWIAERAVALKFFEKALASMPRPELPNDDQCVIADVLSKDTSLQSRIRIDYQCKIFQVSINAPSVISHSHLFKKISLYKKFKARVSYFFSLLKWKLGIEHATPKSSSLSMTIDSYVGKVGVLIKKCSPKSYFWLKENLGKDPGPATRTHKHDRESVGAALIKGYDLYSSEGILSFYLCGSVTRSDYDCKKSDIDIIAIVSDSFPRKKSEKITKKIRVQVPWIKRVNVNYLSISELSGKERTSLLMQIFTPEAFLFTFNEWEHVAGKKFKLEEFPIKPYTVDEEIGFQKAKAMLYMITKDAVTKTGKLGIKTSRYVCYFIHQKEKGPHPFNARTLKEYCTDKTREVIDSILYLSEVSYNNVEVYIRLPVIMKFLKSVKASYPNRHFEPIFKEVLPALDKEGIQHWVFGGVAVAGILGNFIRENKDIDLSVKEADFEKACSIFKNLCDKEDHKDSWKFVLRFEGPTRRMKAEIFINGVERLSLIPLYDNDKEVTFRMGGANVPMLRGDAVMARTEKRIGDFIFYIPQESVIFDILRMVIRVHITTTPARLLSPASKEYRHWMDAAEVLDKKEFDELYEEAIASKPNKFYRMVDQNIGRVGVALKKISPHSYVFLKSYLNNQVSLT